MKPQNSKLINPTQNSPHLQLPLTPHNLNSNHLLNPNPTHLIDLKSASISQPLYRKSSMKETSSKPESVNLRLNMDVFERKHSQQVNSCKSYQPNTDLLDLNQTIIEQIYQSRFLVLKKGKKLGRPVLRWGQITRQGKLLYFKTKTQTQPLGYYSLYQAQTKLTSTKVTPDIAKQLHIKVGDQLQSLQISSQASDLNFTIMVDLKQEDLETQIDTLSVLIELAQQGELMQFHNNQLSRNNINYESLDSSSNDESQASTVNRKPLLTRGQRMLPSLTQSVKIEHNHELLEDESIRRVNASPQRYASIGNSLLQNSQRYSLKKVLNTDEVPSDDDPTESENLEGTYQQRKLIGTLQLMNRGVTSRPSDKKLPYKWLDAAKSCQNLTVNLQESFMKNKAYNNKGDQDDLVGCTEDEELKHPIQPKVSGRMNKYDNDQGSQSLLMQANPFEAFCHENEDITYDQSEMIRIQEVNVQQPDNFQLLRNCQPDNHEAQIQVQHQQIQQYVLQFLETFQISQPLQQTYLDVDKLSPMEALYSGIEASWNFQLKAASTVFKHYAAQGDIRHQLHKLELSFFKVMITGKKSLIDRCMRKVIKFDEQLTHIRSTYNKTKQSPFNYSQDTFMPNQCTYLESSNLINSITPECLDIIAAETLMFKGVLRFLAGCRFKAFFIFRESYKTFKKYEPYLNNTEAPSWFDGDLRSRVQLGIGLFYLGLSALPKSLTTIIRLVGFSANRDKGKQYLKQCIDEKRCRSVYATLILCLFHLDQEPQYEQVCSNLMSLLHAFPHSSLFLWVTSIVSWKYSQLDDAVFFIQRALQTLPQKLEFGESLGRFKEVLRDCLNLECDLEGEGDISLVGKPHYDNIVEKFQIGQEEYESPVKSSQIDMVLHSSPSVNQGVQRKEDFVYLPHRACLTIQLAGVYVALKKQDYVKHWLQTTYQLANQPSVTRSKLDQEMGHLAYTHLHYRPLNALLTYEIIYFLHQMPKLPNSILLQIISDITALLKSISLNLNVQDPTLYKDSPYLSEYVSGMMLTIICYCFLGDQEIATLFSQRLVMAIPYLGVQYSYLQVHSLYWAGRAFLAQGHKREAEKTLLRAKKFKKYEFNIEGKIERVLLDLKQQK